jgi:tripartite-type tricarboxylate transporter receptor subunit TctC
MTETLKQSVIVENRTGAGGNIATVAVAKAPPDGYTILVATASFALNAAQDPGKAGYDPIKDFDAITQVVSMPFLIAVHPSLPVKTVKDLIALAKAKPGEINYASTGNGTLPHLAAEFFKQQAKVNMVHIAYKGSAPATTDLLGGNVQVFFGNMLSVIEQVRAGRLRALAVTSLQRQAVAQDIPTMIESGFPGFEAGTWFGLLAPANTPPAIVQKLNAEIVKIIQQPDVQKQMLEAGSEPIANTSQQMAAQIKAELEAFDTVVKQIKLVVE